MHRHQYLLWLKLTLVCCGILAQGNSAAEESEGSMSKPWIRMDYGPFLSATVEFRDPLVEDSTTNQAAKTQSSKNIAYKGIAIRLAGATTAAGNEASRNVVFDTDLLRYAGAWSGGFLNMTNVAWDGSHSSHATPAGHIAFTGRQSPGWAHPARPDDFSDPRALPYGPLPRDWAHYEGLFVHGSKVVLHYTVGDTSVLDSPGVQRVATAWAFTRALNLNAIGSPLTLHVCDQGSRPARLAVLSSLEATDDRHASASVVILESPESEEALLVACQGAPPNAKWRLDDNAVRLELPRGTAPVRLKLVLGERPKSQLSDLKSVVQSAAPEDLSPLLRGGSRRWRKTLTTQVKLGDESTPLAVDAQTLPADNPWNSWMRLGGFDFFTDGRRAAVCTWNGDVWTVDGLGTTSTSLTWQRVATGLFQPLGLRIVDDRIYVNARDQITILHDLNGDGEADHYENFNNDHQVTEHFHEFALGLQTDESGNFYYAKAARHALDAVVPQHGTVLKISHDGLETEILARGFRAPNGVCVNGDGSFIVSDQEGHWVPCNRINWVQKGGYYGYEWAYRPTPKRQPIDDPICFVAKALDRSPAEQLWVTSDRWGALNDRLISTSYGTGGLYQVIYETVDGKRQGGYVALPMKAFPTGVMRARFHPQDGQLYACGLYGWAGNRTLAGGFYRVRHTGKTLHIPIALHATRTGIIIGFSEPVGAKRASSPRSYRVERWNYKTSAEYGSKDYRISDDRIGRDNVNVTAARISRDERTVFLEIPDMKPCMQMRIRYRLQTKDGARLSQEIYNTIHVLGDAEPHLTQF